MTQAIIIETKKDENFLGQARNILEGHKFSEVREGTFIGHNATSSIVQELKNLESYKKEKPKRSIKIYHGTLNTA